MDFDSEKKQEQSRSKMMRQRTPTRPSAQSVKVFTVNDIHCRRKQKHMPADDKSTTAEFEIWLDRTAY